METTLTSEAMPQYPGGREALHNYISSKIKYPTKCKKDRIEGKVIVRFLIEDNGSVKDVFIQKSVHPDLDKEAIRVVKSMPRWIPGKKNGSPVRAYYSVPVDFKLY